MKRLLVISSLRPGGAERALAGMANYWARRGEGIRLLTLDDGRQPPFYPLHPDVEHRPLGLAGLSASRLGAVRNNLQRIHVLRQQLSSSDADVVLSFMDKTNVMCLLAARGTRRPVVVSERIDPACQPLNPTWRILRRWLYPGAARLVVLTGSARDFFPTSVRDRTRIIPVVVHAPPDERPLVVEPPDGVATVLAMGRLTPQKGFDLLLRAFARVAAEFPRWRLRIQGEGEQRHELLALRSRLDLDGRVELPGLTREPFEVMRQAQMFVMSSRFEGFGHALCEAMAVGLPSLSFDCPSGPGEVIEHDVNGLLVPPLDVPALADAMARMMRDPELRHRLGARAREVRDRFAEERIMDRWDRVLAEATSRPT